MHSASLTYLNTLHTYTRNVSIRGKMTMTRDMFTNNNHNSKPNGRWCAPSALFCHTRCITSLGVIAALSAGCAVTSPHWDYVPESTTAAIPVQAWTPYTSAPIVVECAQNTNAHGGPSPDESAYIVAATIPVPTAASLDSEGTAMYSAAANVTFPSSCWDYFGSYDFWQINMRITQIQPNALGGGTSKKVFSSFDLDGLSCLGSTNGASGTWYGFIDQGCEKTYLGTDEQIPYIVLRINGYSNGLSTRSAAAQPKIRAESPPEANMKTTDKVLPIIPVTPEQVETFRKQKH